MNVTESLNTILDEYERAIEAETRTRKPAEGLLGFGRKPGDMACHEAFDQKIEAFFVQLAAQPPCREELIAALQSLFRAADTRPWPEHAYWSLLAAERHALRLIPLLNREDASALLREYAARYKPWERLPVQKQVIQALKKACGG